MLIEFTDAKAFLTAGTAGNGWELPFMMRMSMAQGHEMMPCFMLRVLQLDQKTNLENS